MFVSFLQAQMTEAMHFLALLKRFKEDQSNQLKWTAKQIKLIHSNESYFMAVNVISFTNMSSSSKSSKFIKLTSFASVYVHLHFGTNLPKCTTRPQNSDFFKKNFLTRKSAPAKINLRNVNFKFREQKNKLCKLLHSVVSIFL